jgi:dTDP-4-dehydrorhamnose 3,5-epimerase
MKFVKILGVDILEVKHIRGTMILQQALYKDERGYFREIYKESNFFQKFKQDNTSFSKAGVLRGLHYQEKPYAQAKYVTVISGKIIDIIVDIRKDSDTFGNYMKIELSAENGKIAYMPEGVAHGFVAIEDSNIIYKCSQEYFPKAEKCIIYNDEFLNINWEIENPIVSKKDLQGKKFNELIMEKK